MVKTLTLSLSARTPGVCQATSSCWPPRVLCCVNCSVWTYHVARVQRVHRPTWPSQRLWTLFSMSSTAPAPSVRQSTHRTSELIKSPLIELIAISYISVYNHLSRVRAPWWSTPGPCTDSLSMRPRAPSRGRGRGQRASPWAPASSDSSSTPPSPASTSNSVSPRSLEQALLNIFTWLFSIQDEGGQKSGSLQTVVSCKKIVTPSALQAVLRWGPHVLMKRWFTDLFSLQISLHGHNQSGICWSPASSPSCRDPRAHLTVSSPHGYSPSW